VGFFGGVWFKGSKPVRKFTGEKKKGPITTSRGGGERPKKKCGEGKKII